MALIACKECGRQLSTTAVSCPSCGAPAGAALGAALQDRRSETPVEEPKPPATRKGRGPLLAIVLTIALAGIAVLFTRPSDRSERSSVKLTATATFGGTEFEVTNLDTFDWTDCELKTGPTSVMLSLGFRYRMARVQARQTYQLPSGWFVDSNGNRFNPVAQRPKELWIFCDTPGGRGAWAAEWK
jgi:hypothetical protein